MLVLKNNLGRDLPVDDFFENRFSGDFAILFKVGVPGVILEGICVKFREIPLAIEPRACSIEED